MKELLRHRASRLLRSTAAVVLGVSCSSGPPEVSANDNRTPAGQLRSDTLVVRLVVQPARWHPEAPDGPYVDAEALGEEDKAPSIPAPLLRARTGTVVSATVRNALPDSTVWLYGLYARPVQERQDSVPVPTGESRTVTFPAGAPGTYAYFAKVGNHDYNVGEREQLTGAFVVDSAGAVPNDRVFVMNIWSHSDSTTYRNVLAINGKSFPYSEGMTATTGDTVRWRWVNGTVRPHPMHLHGFYFSVNARGSFRSDTSYEERQRRTVVTELMAPFSSMAMSWVPDRDGRWLFHCHISFHSVSSGARLDPPKGDHAMMSDKPGEHMAGLVLGIDVKAAAGWTPEARPSPRMLRLFVLEGAKLGRSTARWGMRSNTGRNRRRLR